MKKSILLLFSLLSVMAFSQEAGRAGQLLPNQVEATSGRNNNVQRGGRNNRQNTVYNWSNNYGFSEVFLRIPERGMFRVTIGNQSIENDTGKFRFFDLTAGNQKISIYKNNYLMYRSPISVVNNTRLILDFFGDRGLYLLNSHPIQGDYYGIGSWDDIWNNPYQPGHSEPVVVIMSGPDFNLFAKNVKKQESFDKGKIGMISSQAKHTDFTAKQIKTLMDILDFDNARVELGQLLYPICVDKENFYLVYDALDFESNKRKLRDAIGG